MAIIVKVSEWGNSLAVRLPKAVVDQLGLKAGDEAELTLEGGEVSLRRKLPRVQERHDALIAEARRLIEAGVKPPEPVDWGPDRGGEILEPYDWPDEPADAK